MAEAEDPPEQNLRASAASGQFWGGPLSPGTSRTLKVGLLFWLLKGGFKVSSGVVEWYTIGSNGTDFDDSEIASPVKATEAICLRAVSRSQVGSNLDPFIKELKAAESR